MSKERATVYLSTLDGSIGAYHACPQKPAAGRIGLVIIQEVFGVTASLRRVSDDFADDGFDVLAPAFFDRIEPGVELPADEVGMARGRDYVGRIGFDAPLRDVRAAADHLLDLGCSGVAVIGYCWGGVVAYLSATRLGLPAASYYGRLVPQFLHERPQAPLIFHFGEQDELIPAASISAVAERFPEIPLHRYPAGHAFNRIGDRHFHEASARLARRRTLAFLQAHFGAGVECA